MTADFLASAIASRDAEGLRGLWSSGVALGRVQVEQAVVLSQGLAAVGRQTAGSLGALAQMPLGGNDAVAAATPGHKTAK